MELRTIGIVSTFIVYLLFMLVVGFIYYRKTENVSDYIIGDRKLNSWVTALSSQASDMSGWLLLGLPGYAYLSGLEAIWIAIGLLIGTYLNWKIVAKKLRQYTEIAGNSITLSSYFQNRFKDQSSILRVISALIILIFFLIYTASGLTAGAKLFASVFGISYTIALLISTLVIISYTFLGGFMAVCWTDFFQGMLMFFALIIVPITCVRLSGGHNQTIAFLKSTNIELLNPFTSTGGEALSVVAIISLLAWGLGYFGQPHILTRFMAIKASNQIKKARIIAMTWVTISLFAAVVIGMIGLAYLQNTLAPELAETVFIEMVNSAFPTVLAGILLSAILAAIMSTADSQLLVTTSALTEDIYRVVSKRDVKENELVWISRIIVVIVACIAFIIALNPNSSVLGLVSYAWAGFGAGFGPVIIFSLFWKRMTSKGALAGMISGGATVIIWHKLVTMGLFSLYEIVPGFILASVAIILFSLIDQPPSQEIMDEFDSVKTSHI